MADSSAGSRPSADGAGTRLSLLGRFNLEHAGQTVRLRTRKEEALLAYLVLHPGKHTREILAELFWGDTPEQQAKASLRAALADIRGALGPDMLISDRVVIEFRPEAAISVDALEFQARAAAFLAEESPDPSAFTPCLYAGELLAGQYDDWVLAERERLRQLDVEALLRMVERLRSLSRYDEAIGAAHQALAVDPAEERAHRHLIFLYAVTGNRPAALRQFDACRRILRKELDVEPSAETLALVESILSSTGSLSGPGAGPVDAAAGFTNLPAPLTSFVGREREMAALSRMLDGASNGGVCRLVTLTGPGGSGKTRLAIQVARSRLSTYRHGAWWVDLASVADPSLAPDTVLRALGAAPAPGQPAMQALTAFLRGRTLLLALDNCEHLVEACARLVESILETCAGVQVLATSREPLAVPGEQLWPVPTFSVPACGAGLDAETLLDYDAVRLFLERARMLRPTFSLGPHNSTQVAEICCRLDGIPLAIELAAARVRTMEVDDILARLQNRLRLLASGSTLAPARQQTLRASIDWSYNLLSPPESRLLQRLAVFVGGCTLSAAEAVCADAALPEEAILDLLARLVDRSLVVAEQGRYRFLEAIRDYALERLNDAGEAEKLRDRHAAYFAAYLGDRNERIVSSEQCSAVMEIAGEMGNVRAAWDWALTAGRYDLLRRSSVTLVWYYEMQNQFHEGEAVFARAVQSSMRDRAADRGLLSALRAEHGYLLGRLGRLDEARQELERGCAQLRHADLPYELGLGLTMLGTVMWQQGDYVQAGALLEESLRMGREGGVRHWVSLTLFFLGLLENSTGDYAQADEYFRESLACGRLSGSPRMISMTAVFSAPTLLALGRYAEAEEWLQEGLALARTCGDRWLQGTALGRLGMVMAAQGDRPGARSALLEAQALAQEAGNLWDLAWVQAGLGDVYLSQGDAAQADLHYRAALQLATESNAIPIALDALAGFATLAAQAGDRERALELAGHVSVHPASSSNARARAAEVLRGVALDPSPAAGSFEDIVHRILAGSSPSSSRALI